MTQKTLITLLVDTTTSMKAHVKSTISGLNEYVASMRDQEMDARLSLVTFNSGPQGIRIKSPLSAVPLGDVREFKESDMPCDGMTPLLAAIKITIDEIERALGERRNIKPIMVIQTDGQENSSHLHTYTDANGHERRGVTHEDVKALISQKERAGWEFVFMGCGINAYLDGMKMGLPVEKIVSYGASPEQTESVFRSTANAMKSYISGASMTTMYSAEEKAAAGDQYVQGRTNHGR